MKNKHHQVTSKNGHKFEVIPIIEVVANLDTNDIETQFKADMHIWMCIELDDYLGEKTSHKLKRYVDAYIDIGLILFESCYLKEGVFFVFQQWVLQEIGILRLNEDLSENIVAKSELYKSYLLQNEMRFIQLDKMIKMTSPRIGNKSLEKMARLLIKKPLIDVQLLNEAQNNLFYYLDKSHRYELLSSKNAYYKSQELYVLSVFDYEYYKNPPMYSEYPKEKKIYLKFLKSWLLESIESRRKILGWDAVPNAYRYIMMYANDLLPLEEIAKSPEFTDPLQMLPTPMLMEAPEYPAHIFKSFQAYRLFQTFMEAYKTPAQISFLFRMMAEIEKPPLIHVKDTPFREWFNEEAYHLKLHEHTKTFSNAKNADRIDGYSIVKNLIFSQS